MKKHLIWDWNGTLLDDVTAAVGALNRMLVKRGAAPITVEHYRRRFGFPVRPFYSELGVDLKKWDWDEICEDFHNFILEEPQCVRSDARSALELAKSYGFRQSVLSALRQDKLESAIGAAGFREFFDFVYGVDNLDGASKLQRGRELMAKIGGGESTVFIGDTLHDAEVAKELGAECVIVSCGHQTPERLAASGCHVTGSLMDAVRHVGASLRRVALLAVACAAFQVFGGELTFEEPAPGRDSGRIYYYVPDGIDLSRPVPLLVFLHGGSRTSPDTAPGNYFSEEKQWLMPDIANAPFVVAAPSAPPAPDGSRWNRDGVSKLIDATIEAACRKFNIDHDRMFLGGHSMGCYGSYHLGQILADRFAGVWTSAGAWWETDFRAFLGTPVYIQHGALDCLPRPGYAGTHPHPRCHGWCGVSFGRAAHELMLRDGIEHVYDEHSEGHSLSFPAAKAALRRFLAWTEGKRRNPYAKKIALVTPCGTKHPDVERVSRTRWLELVESVPGAIEVDAIKLHGPSIAKTDDDLLKQTYAIERSRREGGARIVAENMGENRFKVSAENVKRFYIYLSDKMGDLSKPFTVDFGGGKVVTLSAEPVTGMRDYTARLSVAVPVVAGSTGDKMTVGCVNCGAFHYGKGRATPEQFWAEWQRMAKEWPQDVFFYEDVGRQRKPGGLAVQGLDIRAQASMKPESVDVVELPRDGEVNGQVRNVPRYRALRLTFRRGARRLAVYGLHLVAEGHLSKLKDGAPDGLTPSQRLRRRQFKALIEDARVFDDAILTGDFNAQVASEYDVFTEAGFTIANGSSAFGTKATLRDIPADNVILSPGLAFESFSVLDAYQLDTDHFPLVATIRFPAR